MLRFILFFTAFLFSLQVSAQTGIGTTSPHASAKFEVFSENKGFLPPRMTATQRGNIPSPAAGLMVYQTDGTSGLYYYNGSAWIYIINSTTNVVSVVNGGTGTTTSTGTGSVVLNTSPTLTTPTLGVASGTSLALTGTTVSNSTSTGALTVAGGAGIGGALNASSVTATNFIGSGSQLTDVATKVTGSWNVPNGTNNFTIGLSPGTYIIWVNGNIPNGIITYNALVTITNTNVPVAGNYSSWVYTGGNTPLDFFSLPDQIVGSGTTARSSIYSGSNSNNFIFGIRNTTSTTYQVNYGYIKL